MNYKFTKIDVRSPFANETSHFVGGSMLNELNVQTLMITPLAPDELLRYLNEELDRLPLDPALEVWNVMVASEDEGDETESETEEEDDWDDEDFDDDWDDEDFEDEDFDDEDWSEEDFDDDWDDESEEESEDEGTDEL